MSKESGNHSMGCYRGKICGSISERNRNVGKASPYGTGALMIQKQYGYSDRELVEQISE